MQEMTPAEMVRRWLDDVERTETRAQNQFRQHETDRVRRLTSTMSAPEFRGLRRWVHGSYRKAQCRTRDVQSELDAASDLEARLGMLKDILANLSQERQEIDPRLLEEW